MATDTRERVVDAARQLFWEQGYEATSLARIAEASGANPGSVYYFFRTKAEILDAVLEHYERQLGAWLLDPVFERTDDPLQRVYGVIGTYRSFLLETGYSLGCPVGGLALEIDEALPKARTRIAGLFASLTGALVSCFEAMRTDLAPDAPSPETLATLAMTVIEGGIVQARAARSIDPFDRSVEALGDYLERLGRAATPPSAARAADRPA